VGEGGLVRIAGGVGRFRNRTDAGSEEFGGAGETKAAMIGDRGGAEGELEIAGEMELGDSGDRGELGQADAAVVILVQVRAGALDPRVELAPRGRLGRLEAPDRNAAFGQRF